jgi:hypothetical protein
MHIIFKLTFTFEEVFENKFFPVSKYWGIHPSFDVWIVQVHESLSIVKNLREFNNRSDALKYHEVIMFVFLPHDMCAGNFCEKDKPTLPSKQNTLLDKQMVINISPSLL